MLKTHASRDFKKIKAKVGRKIPKSGAASNQKIQISSRKIQIANQLKEDTNSHSIQSILSRLSHYSGVARITALQEMKNLITKVAGVDDYVSLIVPPSLEFLADENKDTRKLLLEFYSILFSLCSAQSFSPTMQIMVTYICSGLTNLSKGIRASSLHFLHLVTTSHPSLLVPFHSKVWQTLYLTVHFYVTVFLAD